MRGPSALPPPPPNFARKKEHILELLAIPDAEYSDASPKGSIDVGIRDLIGEINALNGFVTTSSCAGRVSVFVEGRKAGYGERPEVEGDDAARPTTLAAVGGKGGGGTWLFVSHDPVAKSEDEDVKNLLGLCGCMGPGRDQEDAAKETPKDTRLIHFKFEPMILHVLTASLDHAQLLLRCGLQAGFRESGAINVTSATAEAITPIVAIRSMGLSFESLVGIQEDGVTKCTVSDDYLHSLVRIANERFEENRKRIERFRAALLDANHASQKKKDGTEWEDAQARRERKRAEGLRRKAEIQGQSRRAGDTEESDNVDLDSSVNTDLT